MRVRRLLGPLSAVAIAALMVSGCGDTGSDESVSDSQDIARETEAASSDVADVTASASDSANPAESEATAEESSRADSVASDAQSDDAASASETEYQYSDEPEAASGVVATLCNLDPTYLSSLRNEDSSGTPVVDDDLRLSVLAMSDQVAYWESLTDEYPEAVEDVASADTVVDFWDQALLEYDNGDMAAANANMISADEVIRSMEGDVAPESARCVG